MEEKSKKYPLTIENNQCIDECYYPNTIIIHPYTLEKISNTSAPFCPINPKYDSNVGKIVKIGECKHPTHKIQQLDKKFELGMLNPYIEFQNKTFISLYYNIHNIQDGNIWLKNNKNIQHLYTRKRILNCIFNVYGPVMDIIDDAIVDTLLDIIKQKYIKKMYKQLHKYIGIIDGNIKIVEPNTNKLESKNNLVERTNYIMNTFVNSSAIKKYIEKFIKNHAQDLEKMESPVDVLLDEFSKYLFIKIKKFTQ